MKRLTAKDWFSKTQLEAVQRLCAASFTRRHLYNRYLFLQGPVRTFMVRTCMPSTDKTYVRVVRRDPCAFCGSREGAARYLVPIAPIVQTSRQRKRKQDLFNMTAICQACGSGKRQTPLLHFMLEQNTQTHEDSLSPVELLYAVIQLAENRGSRPTIARLTRRALEAFDREVQS